MAATSIRAIAGVCVLPMPALLDMLGIAHGKPATCTMNCSARRKAAVIAARLREMVAVVRCMLSVLPRNVPTHTRRGKLRPPVHAGVCGRVAQRGVLIAPLTVLSVRRWNRQ